jgi:antitoxin component of MazEF toxin-antitoxin module
MTQAIVTKTGNSYALRVPKRYIEENGLKLGDKVILDEPLTSQRQALGALVKRAKTKGAIKGISDPVAWQRRQRKSSDPWHDTAR